MTNSGRLIIADGFEVALQKKIEQEFGRYFTIDEKVDITIGVRNSRYMDVERQNTMLAASIQNYYCLRRFSTWFFSILPL